MQKRRAKYCEQCGERLANASSFCPNCGAPVPPEETSRPGAHRGKQAAWIAAVLIVVAAIAVGAWLLASRLAVSPVTRFLADQAALFTDRVLEPLQAEDELHAPGALSADVTLTARVDNEGLSSYLDNSSVVLKADVREDDAVLGCQVDLLGSTVLNGTVTYTDGKLGVYLPELDENYYILDLAPAVRDVTGQEPDLSGPPIPLLSLVELRATLAPYWDAVTALVNEQNITRQKDVSGVLGFLPFEQPCEVYAFRPTEQSLEELLPALADILEQDGGLRQLIRQTLCSAIVQLGVSGLGEADLADRLDSALTWIAGTLRDNASSIAKELAKANFTWSVAEEDGVVRQIRLSVTDPDTGAETGLAYEITDGTEGALDEALYAFYRGEVRLVLSHHQERDDTARSGTLRLTAGDTELLTVDYDSESGRLSPLGLPYGSFTLTSPDLQPSLSLTVRDGAGSGTDHVLSLSGLEGYTNGLFNDLTLTANAVEGSSVLPPEPAPVDVSDYSDEQKEEIIDRMGRAFRNDLLANLWPLLRYVL